jgi:hypothetical protein
MIQDSQITTDALQIGLRSVRFFLRHDASGLRDLELKFKEKQSPARLPHLWALPHRPTILQEFHHTTSPDSVALRSIARVFSMFDHMMAMENSAMCGIL